MTARFDIVAASMPDDLRRRVDQARTRDDKAALGARVADIAQSVLPVWASSFKPTPARWFGLIPGEPAVVPPEPARAIRAARLCSAGKMPPDQALAAAEACSRVAAEWMVQSRSIQAMAAAAAASDAARACAAMEEPGHPRWCLTDPAKLFHGVEVMAGVASERFTRPVQPLRSSTSQP